MDKKYSLISGLTDHKLQHKFQEAKHKGIHIKDFFQEFLNNFISEETRTSYLKDLNLFFDFLLKGAERPTNPKHIQAYHFTLYRDWMIERHYAPATINRRLVTIRSFMKWALGCQLIDHNPLQAVRLPKVQTLSPTAAFDDQEVRQMIDHPNVQTFIGNTHRLVLILLFHLGLRRGEITPIKLGDIKRERHHTALLIHGKGDKKRLVPLNELVLEEIEAYQERFSLHTRQVLSIQDFLIQTHGKQKNQRPCNGSTIYRIVNRYAKALGIDKRVGPHSCRATVISHLLDTQKSPIRDVANFVGHQQTTTTERYDKKRKGLDDNAAYQVNYQSEKPPKYLIKKTG